MWKPKQWIKFFWNSIIMRGADNQRKLPKIMIISKEIFHSSIMVLLIFNGLQIKKTIEKFSMLLIRKPLPKHKLTIDSLRFNYILAPSLHVANISYIKPLVFCHSPIITISKLPIKKSCTRWREREAQGKNTS